MARDEEAHLPGEDAERKRAETGGMSGSNRMSVSLDADHNFNTLQDLTKRDLQQALLERGLPRTGNKIDLALRLWSALQNERSVLPMEKMEASTVLESHLREPASSSGSRQPGVEDDAVEEVLSRLDDYQVALEWMRTHMPKDALMAALSPNAIPGKDPATRQLQSLNREAANLVAKIDVAWARFESASGEELKAKHMKTWEQLFDQLQTLETRRSKLERNLLSPGPDTSKYIAIRLVNDDVSVPPLEELADLLRKPLPVKLPVNATAHGLLRDTAEHFVLDRRGGMLSTFVSAAVATAPDLGGKQFTASLVDSVLIRPLKALDGALPRYQRLKFELQRDIADSLSQMTGELKGKSKKKNSLRPDLMLREARTGRLLFKGEEKAMGRHMSEAVTDLTAKTRRWSEYYYGGLEYLLSYAAAGTAFQFIALQRGSPATAVEISIEYDLMDADDRAALVLATFNLYNLLRGVLRRLPRYLLPVGEDVISKHPEEGFTRTLLFRPDQPRVVKKIEPWSSFSEAYSMQDEWLKTVYERTAQRAGLVHAMEGPSFTPNYKVELEPLGLRNGDAAVTSEAQLRHAAHGLLHGLDALHSAGYVHRDLQWANTACDITKEHYFILDLELAAPIDLAPVFNLKSWTPDTLVEGIYKAASDLHLLGQMLQECADLATSTAAKDFLAFIERPAEQLAREDVTAASLLQHEWLKCAGQHCRQAGAQPNTGG